MRRRRWSSPPPDRRRARTRRRCGPPAASAGISPARTSDDLPHPDGPVTTSSGVLSSRSMQCGDLAVTAEEHLRVGDVIGHQPLVRAMLRHRRRGRAQRATSRPGPGSPAPTPTSSAPGSMPSCSTSVWRACLRARRASAWRPQRYNAVARIAQRCSRNGCSATRASATATTSRCSPAASRASSRLSSADSRSSSRRAASIRPGDHPSNTSNGAPRHNSNARPNATAARSHSPSAAEGTAAGDQLLEPVGVQFARRQR